MLHGPSLPVIWVMLAWAVQPSMDRGYHGPRSVTTMMDEGSGERSRPAETAASKPRAEPGGPAVDGDVAATGEPEKNGKEKDRFRRSRYVGYPSFRNEQATGPRFGVRFRYVNRDRDAVRNRMQFDLSVRLSTKLVQTYEAQLALRDLLGRNEWISLRLSYEDDPVFPFVGIANHAELSSTAIERKERYRLDRQTGSAEFVYQEPFFTVQPHEYFGVTEGLLQGFSGLRFALDRLVYTRNSALGQIRDSTISLTRRGSVLVGMAWDNRSNTWNPKRGALHDISVELAGPWAGASSMWARVNLSLRFYRELGTPKLVLANQWLLDGIIGDGPILTKGEFGGLFPVEGIGGIMTGRGFFRRRFIGDAKAYTSLELRGEPLEFSVWRWSIRPGLKGFVDVGKVIEMGQALSEDMQVSGGPGLYMVWSDMMVVRFDAGFSEEGYALLFSADHAF